MDCPHFFYISQTTYAMNENGLYFARFAFFIFLTNFFYRQVENHTKPEIDTPNFGGYAMLDKNSHV